MVDAHDDESDELAPRHVLEALTVPELPYDFADRVMGSLQAAPTVAVVPRRSALPWVLAACTSVLALAATLLLVWALRERASAPPPAVEPALVVAAPAPAAPLPTTPVAAPQELGHLVLTVDPHDATVRIDGQEIPGPSPFVATNLAVGRHELTVEHAQRLPWTRTIDVPVGELALPIVLGAAPVEADDTVESTARVTVMPRAKSRAASPGLKDPFATPSSDPLATDEGSPDLMDPFTKPTKGKGTLRIGTDPGLGPAKVLVDGKAVGTTPIASLKVTAGRHRITWIWPDGRETIQVVDVVADETQLVRGG